MKKLFLQITVLLLMLCLVGCGAQSGSESKDESKKDDRVKIALEAIDEQWEYYEIKNTRIVDLKENDVDLFEGIDYIVEFVLYTDYFGSAPYYSNAGIYDTVSVYTDGHAEINQMNLFNMYRARTYVTDYSDIIEEVIDLGGAYNN